MIVLYCCHHITLIIVIFTISTVCILLVFIIVVIIFVVFIIIVIIIIVFIFIIIIATTSVNDDVPATSPSIGMYDSSRPKTSRGTSHPSPDAFFDYVIPSPVSKLSSGSESITSSSVMNLEKAVVPTGKPNPNFKYNLKSYPTSYPNKNSKCKFILDPDPISYHNSDHYYNRNLNIHLTLPLTL